MVNANEKKASDVGVNKFSATRLLWFAMCESVSGKRFRATEGMTMSAPRHEVRVEPTVYEHEVR